MVFALWVGSGLRGVGDGDGLEFYVVGACWSDGLGLVVDLWVDG